MLFAGWLNPTHHLPWASFYSELPPAAAAAILAASAARNFWRTAVRIPYSAIALLALASIPALQWAFGQLIYGGDAVLAMTYLAGVAVCLSVGATSTHERDSKPLTEGLAWAMLLGALASTAIALQQWFGQADWSEWVVQSLPGVRADSNLRQANHFASLIMVGILAGAYLRTLGSMTATTLGIVAAFLSVGLALSQSRTVWLTALVFVLWAATRKKALWLPLKLRCVHLFPLIAAYALLFWAVIALPGTLLLDAATGPNSRLEAGTRPVLWSQMIEAIRLSPWMGYGWLQGQTAQAAAAIAQPGPEYSTYAHNLVLDLIVWNGLPLGLLLAGLLAWWYFRRGLQATGAADAFRFGVLTVFAVHSMLEYPFAYAYFLVPVALLAGQLEAGDSVKEISPRRAMAQHAGFVACCVVCTGLLVAIARDYVLAEADRREVQMVILRIGGARPFPPVPELWVLDQLKAATAGARIVVRPAMPASELNDLLTVARRYPGAYFLRTSAAALALNGREHEALVELRRLRGLHGERQYQAAIAWLNETAAAQGWLIGAWLAQVADAK
jgi:O-antigen ligase